MTAPNRIMQTFLIRLWRDNAGGEWSGQITHIQTGTRRALTRLAELQTLIAELAPELASNEARWLDESSTENNSTIQGESL